MKKEYEKDKLFVLHTLVILLKVRKVIWEITEFFQTSISRRSSLQDLVYLCWL